MAILEHDEYVGFCGKKIMDKALNTLSGILTGIKIDEKINRSESEELLNWCSLQAELAHRRPFKEIIHLVQSALEDGILTEDEVADIQWVCQKFIDENSEYDLITQSIQQLQGCMHGILADGVITNDEIRMLQAWVDEQEYLQGFYPYDEIVSILAEILKDHIVTEEERDLLKCFIGEFVDTSASLYIHKTEIESLKEKYSLQGLCAFSPDIKIPDSLFCFTGKSSKYTRNQIAEVITAAGGRFNNNVVSGTNYLIVGSENSACWAYSCYGRKVEKAVEARKMGSNILIVHENDFWDAVQA